MGEKNLIFLKPFDEIPIDQIGFMNADKILPQLRDQGLQGADCGNLFLFGEKGRIRTIPLDMCDVRYLEHPGKPFLSDRNHCT